MTTVDRGADLDVALVVAAARAWHKARVETAVVALDALRRVDVMFRADLASECEALRDRLISESAWLEHLHVGPAEAIEAAVQEETLMGPVAKACIRRGRGRRAAGLRHRLPPRPERQDGRTHRVVCNLG
jgi:hypothetical protein